MLQISFVYLLPRLKNMAKILKVSLVILLMQIILNEAATPLFLQSITSALATIPFTGGPMSTGLVGAKLGIGTKLLYYLGYFGRRSRPKPKSVSKTPQKFQSSTRGGSSHLQSLPLPYMLSGGGYPMPGFQSSGIPSGGIDPAQLFQALTAQGVDPNIAMSSLNYAGGMVSNTKFPPFGMSPGFGMNTGANPAFTSLNANSVKGFSQPNKGVPFSNVQLSSHENKESEGGSEDLESFFTFLQDMDENTCISRLICDIGNDQSFLGEFSENIHSMVGSLSVRPSSQAYPYMEIMQNARNGPCGEKFPECSDAAYEVVKSVAPSVDVPTGIDSAGINKL